MKLNFEVFRNKKILVTGHTGFKGSWLALWLDKLGAKVFGIALPEEEISHFSLLKMSSFIETEYVDIRNYEELLSSIKKINPDIIFHLGAQAFVSESYKDPYYTFSTNTYGTINILECIRQLQIPYSVIITTDKVYKNINQIWGYKETDELLGLDPYSNSKSAADIITHSYINNLIDLSKQGIAIARAGNVIGGGDWGHNRIIPDLVKSIENNGRLKIRNPNSTRPWCYVLDPVSGYMQLITKLMEDKQKYSSAYNFGPHDFNNRYSVRNLIEKAISCYGKGCYDIEDFSIGKEANILSLDVTKAFLDLGWNSKFDFDITVKETIDWYKRYKDENILDLGLEFINRYENYGL